MTNRTLPEPGIRPVDPQVAIPRPDGRHDPLAGAARQLLEAAPDPVFLIAIDGEDVGRILDTNELAASSHGYSKAELLTMRIGDLDVEEDAAAVPRRMALLVHYGEVRFDCQHRRKDGSTFPVEVSARLGSVNGRRCAVSFNRDISERVTTRRQLEEDRARLQMTAKAGQIGFWDWDLTSNRVFYSDEWKAQLGYAPHEIGNAYMEWESRLHPDDRRRALATVRDHLEGRRAGVDLEFRMRHKDGSWHWIHARGQCVAGGHGRPTRMVGCHIDVSERIRIEAAKLETENLLRQFYDSPGVMRGIVDLLDDDIRHVSDNAETHRFFGVAPGSMSHKTCTELGLPRPTIEFWLEQYRRCEREGRPTSFDYEHVTADGPHRLFCTVVPIPNPDGHRRFAYAAFDRSAKERAEAEREALVERMRLYFETDPECIKTMAPDGRLLDMNPAGLRFIEAKDLDSVRGQNLLHLIHEDERQAFLDLHNHAVAGGTGTLTYRLRGMAGTERWMETHAVPLRDRNGMVEAVFSISRDITERREMARQREEIQKRLEQQQRIEALGTLAGGIAHDFNNLLASITGNVHLALILHEQAQDVGEFLGEIDKAAARAKALVQQILSFSRQKEPDLQATALAPLVTDAARFLRSTTPASIVIRVELPTDLPTVLGDATQLHQVLINLGTNACHAMEERGGMVRIAAETVYFQADDPRRPTGLAAGEYVRLTVADNGVGMPAATLQHIFEPFFTTKPVGKGTGLGLSVVHGIVQSHGGAITVHSEPGVGTTFEVYLLVERSEATAAAPPVPVEPGSGQRLLVVDDEEALLRSTRRWLEHLGYRVTTCSSPRRALAKLRAAPASFDLLLTDQEMPGMTGMQLAQAAHEVAPTMPVLLYSGFLRHDLMQSAESSGICRVLQKPIDPPELAAVLASVLAPA
jgi:PAS domain S-box-containing protein